MEVHSTSHRDIEWPCRLVRFPDADSAVRADEPHDASQIEPVVLAALKEILFLAVVHGHRSPVLGPRGCGVFTNDPAARPGPPSSPRAGYGQVVPLLGTVRLDGSHTPRKSPGATISDDATSDLPLPA